MEIFEFATDYKLFYRTFFKDVIMLSNVNYIRIRNR